ncbi:MAG: TIGR04283 family arsenosugar biosynthesis glycosyltransferase [Gammaproteobacteria bacterium]
MMRLHPISIIVPVLADTPALVDLVARIRSWPEQPAEILVVSAETNAELQQLCKELGCDYLESIPCRGVQLAAGARATTEEILWFLHADAGPHRDSLPAITAAIDKGAVGGFFGFRLGGRTAWWKPLLNLLTTLRVRLGGTPYGDQGLFATRAAYENAGGFAPQPLFEEVTLVKSLRRQGHFFALALPIEVAARRWERDGWLSRSLSNRILALRYRLGASAEHLAKRYERVAVPNRKATS